MDYHARMYDGYITQAFIQPDSIIPDEYNPESLNRYAYALDNPIRYNDPSGHGPCNGPLATDCVGNTGGSDNPNGVLNSKSSGCGNAGQADCHGNRPIHGQTHGSTDILDQAGNLINNCAQDLGACYMQGWANASSAGSICASNAGFGDRLAACSYGVVWVEGHAVVAVGGTYIVLAGGWWAAATTLTYLGTQNPDAITTVIGGNPEYVNFANEQYLRQLWSSGGLKN